MSDLTDIRDNIQANARAIEQLRAEQRSDKREILAELRELKQIIVGNGSHDRSVLGRLLLLEARLVGWHWAIDKLAAPVITAVIIAAIMYAVYGAP
jgi:hypothetical protein